MVKISIAMIAISLALYFLFSGIPVESAIVEKKVAISQVIDIDVPNDKEAKSELIEHDKDVDKNSNDDEIDNDAQNSNIKPAFIKEPLTQEIVDRIYGVSWREDAPVKLEDLSYITVTHWGFDQQQHRGELIVHKEVGDEILEIFQELYEGKYPIEKMKLIDEYNADDNLSMEDNNTSAFCFRVIEGSQKISNHGYGVAIDINPIQNPYVKGNRIVPLAGKDYVNREDVRKGMIIKGDLCYRAFTSRGWTWGGDWKSLKDYQHFEKIIDLN